MSSVTDKLKARGAASLSDAELLTLLLDDEALANNLLTHYNHSLTALSSESEARLRMVEALGLKRARTLLLSAEFGRRVAIGQGEQMQSISTSEDVIKIFKPQLEHLSHEECWAVYLSSANRILERQMLSQGGINSTVVDHRLVIKRALELFATQIILVHNHPSGSAEASEKDIALTERIQKAAALFDIRILDHIIISREGSLSFLCERLLK